MFNEHGEHDPTLRIIAFSVLLIGCIAVMIGG